MLPKGLHRIRHYGLLASANRAETIARARQLLGLATPAAEAAVEIDPAAARGHSPSLAPAVAAACSSLRPSTPAASHATIQPRLSAQSGSTPHERGRHISHPHPQPRFSLVTIRPRRRSNGQLPGGVFNSEIFPESHPHRGSRESETHRLPPSPDGRALASCIRRQRRDQIAIAPASPFPPRLPRVPSLQAFGRRPRCKPNRRDGPSSETLHKKRRLTLGLRLRVYSYQRTSPDRHDRSGSCHNRKLPCARR